MMNQLANNNNVLNRSFNDQGGSSKPCSASFVDSLEKVVVTNEDVDKGLCCAICQEDFKMGERVIRLPCKDPHYFHCATPEDICGGILPWLNNNNSCPVCREEFPEEEEDIPVPRENFDNPPVDNDNEEDVITPSKMLSFYEDGYTYTLDIEQSIKGRKIQYIKLTPIDSNSEIEYILLGIDSQTKHIYNLIQLGKNGTKTTFTVNSFKTNEPLPKTLFTFEANKYQDYYINKLD